MDFADYIKAAKGIVDKPFSTYTGQETTRVEKQLRLESKLSSENEKEDLLSFIEALQQHKDGLDFLEANPNVCSVLFNNPEKINKNRRIQVKDFTSESIKRFFETCLLASLLEAIGKEFQTKAYLRLFELVKIHRFLPDEAVLSIIKGFNSRLDELQPRLEAKLESVGQEISELKTMIIYLGNEPLKTRWKQMNAVAGMNVLADLNSKESTSEWIVNYFKALEETPKTEIEKEKRKERLRGCNCAMGFIILMIAFFALIILIFNMIYTSENTSETKKEEAKEVFTNGIKRLPLELINFKIDESTIFIDVERPKTNSGILGSDFPKGQVPPFMTDAMIINQTTSDIIVFSTSRTHPIAHLQPTSRYLRAGDTLKWTSYFGTRFYVGQHLKQIKSDLNSKTILRFTEMQLSAKKLLERELEFKGKLIIKDSLGGLFLDKTNTFEYSAKLKVE